jgi:hypothetical protein
LQQFDRFGQLIKLNWFFAKDISNNFVSFPMPYGIDFMLLFYKSSSSKLVRLMILSSIYEI